MPSETADALVSLSVCALEFGLKIYRINTVGFTAETEDKNHLSVVFKSVGGDFSRLLLYLTLFLPEYIPVGIYKNLD